MKKILTLVMFAFLALAVNAKTYKIEKVSFCPDLYSDFVETHPTNSYISIQSRNVVVTLDSVTVFHFSLEPWDDLDTNFGDMTKKGDIDAWERLTDHHGRVNVGFWEKEDGEVIGRTLSFVAKSLRSYIFFFDDKKEVK